MSPGQSHHLHRVTGTESPSGSVQSLGDGLRQAIAELGLSRAFRTHRALLLWPQAVAEVVGEPAAGMSKARQLEAGHLLVAVSSDAWRHRLGMEREALRRRINDWTGADTVLSIRFVRS